MHYLRSGLMGQHLEMDGFSMILLLSEWMGIGVRT